MYAHPQKDTCTHSSHTYTHIHAHTHAHITHTHTHHTHTRTHTHTSHTHTHTCSYIWFESMAKSFSESRSGNVTDHSTPLVLSLSLQMEHEESWRTIVTALEDERKNSTKQMEIQACQIHRVKDDGSHTHKHTHAYTHTCTLHTQHTHAHRHDIYAHYVYPLTS